MKLAPDVEFHEDIRLFIYRPHGVIDEQAIKKVISILEDLEARLREPFNRFSDTLGADEVELNFKYVIQVSLCRRLSYAGHPPVKSAILATDSTIIHYGRLHAVLTQGSPINVRVFKDRQETAEWLNVPIERLMARS
ncbi:MAG: hypothetical protein DMF00_07180 [Verrucomicrobia bacterium]|nr:MAG: hypothetical protein DMF00_07180 [Verrucomicrobiota bacterium]